VMSPEIWVDKRFTGSQNAIISGPRFHVRMVSNDFVAPLSSPRHGAAQIAQRVLILRSDSSLADVALRKPALIFSAEPAVPSGPELLRLLSIQRK
jgi:hypothetical protein